MSKLRAPQIDTGIGANQIVELDSGGKIPEATSGLLMASKLTDEGLLSSTVLQDDDELFVTIPGAGFYIINLYLITDGPIAAGFSFQFNYADVINLSFLSQTDGVAGNSGIDSTPYVNSTNPGSPAALLWTGFADFQNTGLLKLQWAQDVSDAGTTILFAGSYLSLHKAN